MTNRPSKTETFMKIAAATAEQSLDPRSKFGCVLINQRGRVISTGYNSLPRDFDNNWALKEGLGFAPEKYSWFRHAEENAITNSEVHLPSVRGVTAYVTAECCFECTTKLWNHYVEKVVYIGDPHLQAIMVIEENKNGRKKKLVEHTKMTFSPVFLKDFEDREFWTNYEQQFYQRRLTNG